MSFQNSSRRLVAEGSEAKRAPNSGGNAMNRKLAAVIVPLLLAAAATPSFADDEPGREPGRYTLLRAGSNFLRLDTATGALSLCRQKLAGWACEGVTDDLSALKQEIDRLSKETEELKQRLAKTEAELEAEKARPVGPAIQIPGVSLDEMNALADKIMRRLQDMVRELKRQESERAL
jgi:hypothetical protein